MNNIIKAKVFAKVAHYGQKYGENKPYFFHLNQVYQKGKSLGASDHVLTLCLLHDVLEDTKYTRKNIKKFFGPKIAHHCWILMDKEGKNREERHKNTYPMIGLMKDTTFVKLCDRYCNVKYSLDSGNQRMFNMYKKEHEYFKKTLYVYEEHRALQEQIDDLFTYSVSKSLSISGV